MWRYRRVLAHTHVSWMTEPWAIFVLQLSTEPSRSYDVITFIFRSQQHFSTMFITTGVPHSCNICSFPRSIWPVGKKRGYVWWAWWAQLCVGFTGGRALLKVLLEHPAVPDQTLGWLQAMMGWRWWEQGTAVVVILSLLCNSFTGTHTLCEGVWVGVWVGLLFQAGSLCAVCPLSDCSPMSYSVLSSRLGFIQPTTLCLHVASLYPGTVAMATGCQRNVAS